MAAIDSCWPSKKRPSVYTAKQSSSSLSGCIKREREREREPVRVLPSTSSGLIALTTLYIRRGERRWRRRLSDERSTRCGNVEVFSPIDSAPPVYIECCAPESLRFGSVSFYISYENEDGEPEKRSSSYHQSTGPVYISLVTAVVQREHRLLHQSQLFSLSLSLFLSLSLPHYPTLIPDRLCKQQERESQRWIA